jgi:hypothetical protein
LLQLWEQGKVPEALTIALTEAQRAEEAITEGGKEGGRVKQEQSTQQQS